MAHDVFISYAAQDKATADAVCASLESSGIRCWMAPRDVRPGHSWPQEIVRAISHCQVLILIFSANSNNSDMVNKELGLAVNRRLAIIPFRLEPIDPVGQMEFYLSGIHWLDALTPPLKEHIASLCRAVKEVLPLAQKAPAAPQSKPGTVSGKPRVAEAPLIKQKEPIKSPAKAKPVTIPRFSGLRAWTGTLINKITSTARTLRNKLVALLRYENKWLKVSHLLLIIFLFIFIVFGIYFIHPLVSPSEKYARQGDANFKKKNYDQAIADYTKLLEINPKNENAYFRRAFSYNNKKQFDQAIADYTKVLEINPKEALAYNNRGWAYEQKKDLDRALGDYTKALEINPKSVISYRNRGWVYAQKKDFDRALADYAKALEINPKDADVYLSRGNAYFNNKQYDQAIADYSKALELNPKQENAYYNRGLTYAHKKEFDQAIADHTKVLEMNPRYDKAYNQRGLAYANKKDSDRAKADYDKALEINPKSDWTYYARGALLNDQGRRDQALAEIDRALSLNPKHSDYHRLKAIIYDNLGRPKDALEAYKSFLQYVEDIPANKEIIQGAKNRLNVLEKTIKK